MAELDASRDLDPQRPTVVYIAGSGRSGSTLLERILGAMPGYVNVGELLDLPRKVAPRDELCGCGVRFSLCPFWSGVGQRAFGGWSSEVLQDLHRLQTLVARQRHLPRLLGGHAGPAFTAALGRYGERYAEIYAAAASTASARYVVDASKWPAQALALHRGGIDVRVVHLVRDVRGHTHSMNRQNVLRPHARADEGEAMWHNAPALGAANWLATQTEVDLLRARRVPVARVRYRDLVAQPRTTIERALRQLSVEMPGGALSHIDGRTVTLGPSHGLSGNPSRFTHGPTVLRSDDRWRSEMRRRDQLLVTAIGLPQMVGSHLRPPDPSSPDREGAAPAQAASKPVTSWPLVSVILATRGRPELVREALASVLHQNYPGAIEAIVVHDQEPAQLALTELTRPGRAVSVVNNLHTPGLAGARNTGVDLARGAFIATCDDDDSWHPTKLQRQMQRFRDDPDVLMLGSGLRYVYSADKAVEWPGRAERITYDLLLRNRVKELHSSVLIMRRDAFAKAGRYDESLPGGYAEDYDWVLRVARVGKVGVVVEPLADIRQNVPSYYRGKAARTAVALEYFLAKHPEIAASRRGHARLLGQMAFNRSCVGERGPAMRLALHSLSRWPLSPHPYVALGHLATGADPRYFADAARLLGKGMA